MGMPTSVTEQEENEREDRALALIDMPEEIVLKIFEFLRHDDLMALMRAFPNFKACALDAKLWRKRVHFDVFVTFEELDEVVETVFRDADVRDLKVTGSYFGADVDPTPGENLSPDLLDKIRVSCPHLRRVVLNGYRLNDENDPLPRLSGDLRAIGFSHTRFAYENSDWFGELSRMQDVLVSVKLEYCSGVDSAVIAFLSEHTSLRELSLRGTEIVFPPHFFVPLPRWRVERLDVSETDHACRLLARCFNLGLAQTVTHLYAERCGFVLGVRFCRRLERVSVAGSEIYDDWGDIGNWASRDSVRFVNASGCGLSSDVAERLSRGLPNAAFDFGVEYRESPRVSLSIS